MSVNTPTSGDNDGQGTTPSRSDARYTDDDMSGMKRKLRRDYERDLSRERESASQEAVSVLLGDLGVDDADELRALLDTARKSQGQQSEAELAAKKLQRERDKLAKDAEEAQKRLAELEQRDRMRLSREAVQAAAKEHGAHDDLVWALARDRVTISESGDAVGVDGASVSDMVKQLVESDSRLRTNPQGAGSLPSGTSAPETPNSTTIEGMSAILDEIGIGR
jgi:hypothetical protein